MDEPQALQAHVIIDLLHVKFCLTLNVTRAAFGLMALIVATVLLSGDAGLAVQAMICSFFASSRMDVTSRRITC